ncbi:putative NADH-flavin reductase [Lipingzhangella halophila]|uniref:Putative NADH-flavin reductase n=1 Tax=Lipingzhangella halophila TaxID=1783352 RepID=A0A7W7RND0_9ACTN|nr:NAD(P)H-binding protein [Lipingzhangella halophila]MBB4935195.1 putative NADH-flavin reductase [Lipingzhangella halophila]
MRVAIFGANGGTGRILTRQAIDAGHDVVAVTRHPGEFPLAHDRLAVAEADVHDPRAVARAAEGSNAVLSTLGVPFSRKPITVYSKGIANITGAMARHGIPRIVAVSSSATEPHHHAEGGFLLNRVVQPLVTRTIGRTTYADMRIMERHLEESDLEWTVMRPSGLFHTPSVTAYRLQADRADGVFTSRADLAASMLAQLASSTWVRRKVAVTTTEGTPTLLDMLRGEALGRAPEQGGPAADIHHA